MDWGNALKLVPATSVSKHGTLAFAADGYFGEEKKQVHAVMDLAPIAYTWLAIVYGNGEAPWDLSKESRAAWMDTNAALDGVARAKKFLQKNAGVARAKKFLQKDAYTW